MDKRFIEHCETEALHLSGAIQPHGALLVLDANGRVSHASANTATFLDAAPDAWLEKPLPDRFATLMGLAGAEPGSRGVVEAGIETSAGLLDVVVTRGPRGALTLEFVPATSPDDFYAVTSASLTDVPSDPDALQAQRQALVDEIAALTGFERVMFYCFLQEDDGEVVAETRRGDAYGSYLGLRFPASDIPRIARALYMKNPWRLIPDATAEAVPVLGRAEPPDLTWSDLRSVSPVHRIYLTNMGVAASLSFPVIGGGELVALVSAHHSRPARPSLHIMEYAAAMVRNHSFTYTSYLSQRRMRMIDGLAHRFHAVQAMLHRHGELVSAWPELGEWLCRELQVDGATLCQGETVVAVGAGFEADALAALDGWFTSSVKDFVWVGDNLARQVPAYPLSELAGVIAIRLGQRDGASGRIYLGRQEHIYEVTWGGNPNKPVEYHDNDNNVVISPRRSFEKWVERRLGYSRPWDNETRLLALKLRQLLLSFSQSCAR